MSFGDKKRDQPGTDKSGSPSYQGFHFFIPACGSGLMFKALSFIRTDSGFLLSRDNTSISFNSPENPQKYQMFFGLDHHLQHRDYFGEVRQAESSERGFSRKMSLVIANEVNQLQIFLFFLLLTFHFSLFKRSSPIARDVRFASRRNSSSICITACWTVEEAGLGYAPDQFRFLV